MQGGLRRHSTVIGALLGAAAAIGATSETARSSRLYWWLTDRVATPLLRRIPDPETAHNVSVFLLKARLGPIAPKSTKNSEILKTKVFGLDFESPLGLAAGFDKQATAYNALLDMGFAFVEVGGITPKPQPGNPKPRMFRLEEDEAVINRYGLNSEGHVAVASRLLARDQRKGYVGVNLAKNSVPNAGDFASDYVLGVETLGPVSDFIVLNVSCPNVKYTKDMKDDELKSLVMAVRAARDRVCQDVPFLIKVGPDMNDGAKQKIATIAIECGVDGLVVTNTTSTRPDVLTSSNKVETGGLSGKPLKGMATETLRDLYRLTNGAVPIIGVGGISSGRDAYERIRNGASLIQVYTALAYQGPGLVTRIKEELQELVIKDGFKNISECVGIDVDGVSRTR